MQRILQVNCSFILVVTGAQPSHLVIFVLHNKYSTNTKNMLTIATLGKFNALSSKNLASFISLVMLNSNPVVHVPMMTLHGFHFQNVEYFTSELDMNLLNASEQQIGAVAKALLYAIPHEMSVEFLNSIHSQVEVQEVETPSTSRPSISAKVSIARRPTPVSRTPNKGELKKVAQGLTYNIAAMSIAELEDLTLTELKAYCVLFDLPYRLKKNVLASQMYSKLQREDAQLKKVRILLGKYPEATLMQFSGCPECGTMQYKIEVLLKNRGNSIAEEIGDISY